MLDTEQPSTSRISQPMPHPEHFYFLIFIVTVTILPLGVPKSTPSQTVAGAQNEQKFAERVDLSAAPIDRRFTSVAGGIEHGENQGG
jgi:hypothetical protein